jgi:NAD kinase
MESGQRIVIVRMKTRLQQLVEKFNTLGQAMFSLSQQRRNFMSKASKSMAASKEQAMASVGSGSESDYQDEDKQYQKVLETAHRRLSIGFKVMIIDRSFLPSFLFGPQDIVVVIGQDGLVANTAKYAGSLPIVAVNPAPDRFDGVLLPFRLSQIEAAVQRVASGKYDAKRITMAEVSMNDGQRLLAFNDFFIGPSSHTSARYQLTHGGRTETQSSSGVIVSTGAGATGWLSSLFNMQAGMAQFSQGHAPSGGAFRLPWDTQQLVYAVREPFASRTSQASLVMGYVDERQPLVVESLMPERGVIFSDGIESDFLAFNSGSIATIGIASEQARLVV